MVMIVLVNIKIYIKYFFFNFEWVENIYMVFLKGIVIILFNVLVFFYI